MCPRSPRHRHETKNPNGLDRRTHVFGDVFAHEKILQLPQIGRSDHHCSGDDDRRYESRSQRESNFVMPKEEKESYRSCDVGHQFGWVDLVVEIYLRKIEKRTHVSKPHLLSLPMENNGGSTLFARPRPT